MATYSHFIHHLINLLVTLLDNRGDKMELSVLGRANWGSLETLNIVRSKARPQVAIFSKQKKVFMMN